MIKSNERHHVYYYGIIVLLSHEHLTTDSKLPIRSNILGHKLSSSSQCFNCPWTQRWFLLLLPMLSLISTDRFMCLCVCVTESYSGLESSAHLSTMEQQHKTLSSFMLFKKKCMIMNCWQDKSECRAATVWISTLWNGIYNIKLVFSPSNAFQFGFCLARDVILMRCESFPLLQPALCFCRPH